MVYLGSERVITNSFSNHISAVDYSGNHLSNVSINSTCKVINVINKFKSHENSINYNDFLNNKNKWLSGNIYNCISITGNVVPMKDYELGGNQIHLETYYNNSLYIIKLFHLDNVIVNIGDIVNPNQLLGYQGNTGLVLSNKSHNDITYGSHVHIEVIDSNGNYIDPSGFADGSISGTYNEPNNIDKIKILVDSINIRENPSVESKDIGNVYFNEIYDVIDIVDTNIYTWYKIKKNNSIGYIANKKDENWISFISKKNEEDYKLIFTCSKEDYYYLKLYEGESLYIKKQD